MENIADSFNSARLILILNSNLLFRNKHITGGGDVTSPESPEFPAIHDLPTDGVKRRYLQMSEANDVDRPQRRAPPDLAGLGWTWLGPAWPGRDRNSPMTTVCSTSGSTVGS